MTACLGDLGKVFKNNTVGGGKRSSQRFFAFKKIFPGGTIEELQHYISKTLTDNQLDGIIINAGLNSLHNGKHINKLKMRFFQ